MTIARDAFSKGTPGSSAASPIEWTHTPVGTPRGAVVGANTIEGNQDQVGAVTYGGVVCAEVSNSPWTNNVAGQANDFSSHLFFLGSGLPTGAQTVSVEVTNSDTTAPYALTVTADGDAEVENNVGGNGTDTSLGLNGQTCLVAMTGCGGAGAGAPTAKSGWTAEDVTLVGNDYAVFFTYDTVASADVTAGWNDATQPFYKSWGAVAIKEVAGGGGGSDTITAEAGSYTVTGNAADTLHDRNLVAEAGSFALSGLPAATAQGYSSAAEAGAYSLTGGDADFQRDHVMAAEAGGYAVTGLDVTTTDSGDVTLIEDDTGFVLAGTGEEDTVVGTRDWSFEDTINDPDSSPPAISSVSISTVTTYYLKSSQHGFAVPSNATILGVALRVRARRDFGDGITFANVSLAKAGTVSGANRASGGVSSSSYVNFDFGGSTDLWGLSLTPSDVNDSGFGGAVAFILNDATVEVAAIWLQVFFAVPGISLQANQGSYIVTGLAADLARTYGLVAEIDAYDLTGLPALTTKGARLAADAGAYALTGPPAAFPRSYYLTAEAGAYALTGLAADLLTKLIAEPGVYLLDGREVATLWDRALIAALGDYTLTGLAAETAPAFGIVAAPGSYLLTGLDAELRHFKVAAELGLYTIDGLDAGLSYNRFMAVDAGAYVVSGLTVAFLGGEYWSDAGAAGGAWSEAGEAGGLWTDANPSGTSWN